MKYKKLSNVQLKKRTYYDLPSKNCEIKIDIDLILT